MTVDLRDWPEQIIKWAQEKCQISEIWIFGSRARGTHGVHSDLDIAVRVFGNKDERFNLWYWQFPSWKRDLQTLLPVTVDLRLLDAEIPEEDKVMPAVEREGIFIFQRKKKVA